MLTTSPESGVVNGNEAHVLGLLELLVEIEIVCDGGCRAHTSPRTTTSSSIVGPGAGGSAGAALLAATSPFLGIAMRTANVRSRCGGRTDFTTDLSSSTR